MTSQQCLHVCLSKWQPWLKQWAEIEGEIGCDKAHLMVSNWGFPCTVRWYSTTGVRKYGDIDAIKWVNPLDYTQQHCCPQHSLVTAIWTESRNDPLKMSPYDEETLLSELIPTGWVWCNECMLRSMWTFVRETTSIQLGSKEGWFMADPKWSLQWHAC